MRNRDIFQQFWFLRSNYNSDAISTCCDKSDGLSRHEWRAVSSAQIAILHKHNQGDNWSKKRDGSDRILTQSRVNGTLRIWLVLLGNS